ncbi:phosphatase PAP2 family protein [Motilimonas cestriensis]|uniref:phosphatase PAP2 family protein n=1 Tax=Motilimonas cestriensis TaxID=2742685 RepID=UPI003DA4C887
MARSKIKYAAWLVIWLILLVTPSVLLLGEQALFPWLNLTSGFAAATYFLTSTGTAPYAVATVIIFLAVSYFCIPKDNWKKMTAAVALSLLFSVGFNYQLKSYFAEARPNITFLASQVGSPIDLDSFYNQNASQRSALVAQALEQYQHPNNRSQLSTQPPILISPMIQQHWINEVGYSFPSGHTIFAATFTLTAGYYLLLSGALGLNLILLCWGAAMGLSRMLLGMHWSQDVVVSTCLAAVISAVSISVIARKWSK